SPESIYPDDSVRLRSTPVEAQGLLIFSEAMNKNNEIRVPVWMARIGEGAQEVAVKEQLGPPASGLIKPLCGLRAFLERFEGSNRSARDNSKEAIRHIGNLIGQIQSGKMPKRREIEALVAPGGIVQRVSLNRGWGAEFVGLAAGVDKAMSEVYGEQESFC